jgi:hypothetical protein
VSIVVEARGGTAGTPDAVNTQYREGLLAVLEGLFAAGLRVANAEVDSTPTQGLTAEQRRIPMDDYPLTLADAAGTTAGLMRGQATVNRRPNARGGGNQTRRIRLVVEGHTDARALAAALVGA